jgi:hypothetical protein
MSRRKCERVEIRSFISDDISRKVTIRIPRRMEQGCSKREEIFSHFH